MIFLPRCPFDNNRCFLLLLLLLFSKLDTMRIARGAQSISFPHPRNSLSSAALPRDPFWVLLQVGGTSPNITCESLCPAYRREGCKEGQVHLQKGQQSMCLQCSLTLALDNQVCFSFLTHLPYLCESHPQSFCSLNWSVSSWTTDDFESELL